MIFDPIPALLPAVDWLTATSSSLAGARPLTKWGWAGELPPAVELGDFVLLHEEVDALDHAGRHFAGTTEGFAEVDGDVPANTEGLGLLGDDVG